MRCVQIIVEGKVQGVFFRQRTKEKARSLKLNGFVRNETNGSVYIEAGGEADNVQQLIEWCNTGPQQAKVEKVHVIDVSARQYHSFDIRH